jgi:hypothetical protein
MRPAADGARAGQEDEVDQVVDPGEGGVAVAAVDQESASARRSRAGMSTQLSIPDRPRCRAGPR